MQSGSLSTAFITRIPRLALGAAVALMACAGSCGHGTAPAAGMSTAKPTSSSGEGAGGMGTSARTGESAAPVNIGPPPAADAPQDCRREGDGGRSSYHDPAGDTWLTDCSIPWAREYWRVFQDKSGRAYTMPRADGDPRIAEACKVAACPLRPLLTKYALCGGGDTPSVNSMEPEEALQITRYLHGKLRFVASGEDVDPWPIPDDIADGCRQFPEARTGVMTTVCEDAIAAASGAAGEDGARGFTAEQATAVAALLNRLYGIPR